MSWFKHDEIRLQPKFKGRMDDSNVRLTLRDGTVHDVLRPTRVGVEFETPWLDTEGSREWNASVDRVYDRWTQHQLGSNPRFIIGKWGSRYQTKEDVDAMIPLEAVVCIEALPDPPHEVGCPGPHCGECHPTAPCLAVELNVELSYIRQALEYWFQQQSVGHVAQLMESVLGRKDALQIVRDAHHRMSK